GAGQPLSQGETTMFTFRTLPARLMFADDPAEGGGGPKPGPKPAAPQPDPDLDPEPPGDPDPDDGDDIAAQLEAQRKINRDLERKLKRAPDHREKVAELEAELAKAQGREAEFAELQKQREVESAALTKANERILKAEIRAAAAGRLADPADALR